MANWHGLVTGAASTLRRGRTAMAVLGAAIAGAAPPPEARLRVARPPRLVWQVPGEGRGTPALDVSTAYFLSRRHEVVAVHRRTGRVRWRQATGEPGQTTAGSAVVAAGDIVIAGDYNLVAFDRADGAIRWRFVPVDGYGPGIYLGGTDAGLVFAGSPAGRLYAVETDTGRLRWSLQVSAVPETTVYPPVVDRGAVVAGFMQFPAPGSGGLVAADAATGRELWRARFPDAEGPASRPAGGPMISDDWVMAASGDGAIHRFARRDGTRQATIPALQGAGLEGWAESGQDFRSLAFVRPTLFAGSLSGTVAAYRAGTGAERWRRTTSQASTAFGIRADRDLVYVPHLSGDLVALDARDGREWWRLGRGSGFRWPPAVDQAWLFLAGSHGGFFAYQR
jgi:outer membrane protein assembly factor BamB